MLQLLLCLTLASGDPVPSAPLLVRTYDVSSAIPWHPAPRSNERLFPMISEAPQVYDSDAWSPDASEIAMLVNEVFDEEFTSEGRAIWDDGRGHLVVRAPEAAHTGVAQLLAALEAANGRSIEVAIDVVHRPSNAPPLASSLVAPEEAERVLGSGGERSSYVLRLPPNATGWISATNVRDACVGADVQIAQAAAVLDPVVATLDAGLRIAGRAATGPGGVWLALCLRDVAAADEVREIPFEAPMSLKTDNGRSPITSRGELTAPEMRTHSLVLNTLLPEGKTLLAQTSLSSRGSNRAALVALRLIGKAPPRTIALPGAHSITLHAEAFAAPPRARLSWTSDSGAELDGERTLQTRNVREWNQSVHGELDGAELGQLTNLFPENLSTSMYGSWIVARPMDDGSSAPLYTSEDLPTLLARLAPSPRVLQLRFELRKGSTSVARASIPARLGEESGCVLGAEQIYVGDYDVEVAQDVTASAPRSSRDFEGLILRATPRASTQGELALDVAAIARVRRPQAEGEAERTPTIAAPTARAADELSAREVLVFPRENARPLVLGDLTGAGLSLSVELVEAR